MDKWVIGIIGGSGLYDIEAITDRTHLDMTTPWGKPSDPLLAGRIGDVEVRFLPRHGRGHRAPPTALNFRANIAALKMAGCTDLLSVSAVGSLREHLAPGAFVAVDQFIDRTFAREKSFFGEGMVAHVSLADPTCPRLSAYAMTAGHAAGAAMVEGGVYLAMEGPQFSTRAESRMYRAWGCDVIGMTNMPEAKLAREAELPYAAIAMVTDYDCWRPQDGEIDVPAIIACMQANSGKARQLVENFVRNLPPQRPPSPIDLAMEHAIITAPEARDPALRAKLQVLLPRLFAND
jgi:5'-methylthioadenosine phosphorylase